MGEREKTFLTAPIDESGYIDLRDTPAPIATPEEVERVLNDMREYAQSGSHYRFARWARAIPAEIERLARERDEARNAELDARHWRPKVSRTVPEMLKMLPEQVAQLSVPPIVTPHIEGINVRYDTKVPPAMALLTDLFRAIADRAEAAEARVATLTAEVGRMREALEWRPTHEHFKGGLYRVIARGRIEANLTPCVIYDNEKGETWVRPADDFDQTDPFARFAALSPEPEAKET